MGRSSLRAALCLALCLGATQRNVASIEHFRVSRADEFLCCLRKLLGKPVFRDPGVFWNQVGARTPGLQIVGSANARDLVCPLPRDSLVKELKSRGVMFVEASEWAFLHQMSRLRGEGILEPWIRWKQLAILSKADNWGGIPGTRLLTPEELDVVSKVIFREARTAPILTPTEAAKGSDTATVTYFARLTAYSLGKDRPESVVGILGELGGTSRLAYGELKEAGYEILWDSPLFPGTMLNIGFEDVDGDGVREILLQAAYGLNLDAWTLSIFNIKGQELTRQPDCFGEGYWGYDEAGGVCPIAAQEFTLDEPRDGKRDLLVRGRREDLGEYNFERLHRYSLRDGRYVYVGEVDEDQW